MAFNPWNAFWPAAKGAIAQCVCEGFLKSKTWQHIENDFVFEGFRVQSCVCKSIRWGGGFWPPSANKVACKVGFSHQNRTGLDRGCSTGAVIENLAMSGGALWGAAICGIFSHLSQSAQTFCLLNPLGQISHQSIPIQLVHSGFVFCSVCVCVCVVASLFVYALDYQKQGLSPTDVFTFPWG